MSIRSSLIYQVNISSLLLQTALPAFPTIVNFTMKPSGGLSSEFNRGRSVWRFERAYHGAQSPDPHSPENDRYWKLETIEYDNRPHLDDAKFFKVIHSKTMEKKGLTPEEFATFAGGVFTQPKKPAPLPVAGERDYSQ